MKKFLLSTKTSILVAICFTSALLAKGPIGLIEQVEGNAFYYSSEGTKPLTKGTYLSPSSIIITEEGSAVTYSDFRDHQFHIAGGTQFKVGEDFNELLAGDIWVKSQSHQNQTLKTANAQVVYAAGEMILSFDSMTAKTQLLSLKGGFDFMNLLDTLSPVYVKEGTFSFIDLKVEGGIPRTATSIGQSSFKKMLAIFPKVLPMDPTFKGKEDPHTGRGIASIEESSAPTGDLSLESIYQKELQRISQDNSQILKAKSTKVLKAPKMTRSNVAIHIFGMNNNGQTVKSAQKVNFVSLGSAPSQKSHKAIVAPLEKTQVVQAPKEPKRVPASVIEDSSISIAPLDEFSSSLNKQYQMQMKNKKEVNTLIDELKSYQSDHKSTY